MRNSKLLLLTKLKKGNQKKLSLNTDTGCSQQRLQWSYYKNDQRNEIVFEKHEKHNNNECINSNFQGGNRHYKKEPMVVLELKRTRAEIKNAPQRLNSRRKRQ